MPMRYVVQVEYRGQMFAGENFDERVSLKDAVDHAIYDKQHRRPNLIPLVKTVAEDPTMAPGRWSAFALNDSIGNRVGTAYLKTIGERA
jgi:hypothetical protein